MGAHEKRPLTASQHTPEGQAALVDVPGKGGATKVGQGGLGRAGGAGSREKGAAQTAGGSQLHLETLF